jgi:hypothetical protein
LFLAALDLYLARIKAMRFDALEHGSGGLEDLCGFLEANVESMASVDWKRHCLIARATIEMEPGDLEIAQRANTHFARLERSYRSELGRAVSLGELPERSDLDAMAQHLSLVTQGMFITARLQRDRRSLLGAVDRALGALPAILLPLN